MRPATTVTFRRATTTPAATNSRSTSPGRNGPRSAPAGDSEADRAASFWTRACGPGRYHLPCLHRPWSRGVARPVIWMARCHEQVEDHFMIVGTILVRMGGVDTFSPQFGRGGNAALFSCELLDFAGSAGFGLSVTVEHKNSGDTA